MFFNKKNKNKPKNSITYLDIKNGKVVESKDINDLKVDAEDKAFYEHNYNVDNTKNTDKPNSKKNILKIGITCTLLPIAFLSFSLTAHNFKVIKDTMSGSHQLMNKDGKRLVDNNNVKINENNIFNSKTNKGTVINDVDNNSKVNTSDLSSLTDFINKINLSILTSYNNMKLNVEDFYIGKVNALITSSRLHDRLGIVNDNINILENNKLLFEKTNQLDLFYKIKERYLNLQSLLTTLTTKVDSDNILKLTNNAIINDNALLDDETALIKDMFNNNKIEYKFENNEFELK